MSVPYVGGNANFSELINATNTIAREINNKSIVQQFKDTTGTPRIILGRLPDGTHGLVISKEDVDVTSVFS